MIDDLSKKVSTHDLFAHLFPGLLYLTKTAVSLYLLDLAKPGDWPLHQLRPAVTGLNSWILGAMVLTCAYSMGIVALGVGDLLSASIRHLSSWITWICTTSWAWSRRSLTKLGVDPTMSKRSDESVPSIEGRSELIRINAEYQELAKQPGRTQFVQSAIAYLTQLGKDGTIQLNSGRRSMYLGLAGVCAMLAPTLLFVLAMNNKQLWCPKVCIEFVFLLAIGIWCLWKARGLNKDIDRLSLQEFAASMLIKETARSSERQTTSPKVS